MRLGWPAFEKKSRELIRHELAASPAQLSIYKRNRSKKGRQLAPWLQRIGLTYLLLAIFASMLTSRSLELGLTVFTLWMLGSAFRRAQQWFEFFYASPEIPALHLLPLHDDQVFSVQWRKFSRAALWLLPEFLLGFFILWFNRSIPFHWFAFTAILQAALVFALGLHFAAWLSFLPLGFLAGLFKAIALAMLFLANWIQYSDWLFRFFFLTSPPGWANYLLRAQTNATDLTALLLLIPIAAILYSALYSFYRLRNFYSLDEIEFDIRLQTTPHPISPQSDDQDSRRLGPTEIEDNVRDRFFLQSLQWENAGWMERWVARFLNPREKVVAEFLVAENPGWSLAFNWSFVLFGIAITAVSLLTSGLTIFFPGILLLVTAFPFFQGNAWRGLSLHGFGGGYSGSYAYYPISFDEITRVLLKANLARSIPGLPLVLTFVLYAGWKADIPFPLTLTIAGKVFACMLATIPIGLVMPISSTTNDTSRMPGIWVVMLLVAALVVLPLGIILFLSSSFLWAVISITGISLSSFTFYRLYRWSFKKGKFDLVRLRPD